MGKYKIIGDYLKQIRRQVILEDHIKYKLLGVKWYGQGMFLREEKYGKEIKAEKLYQVKKGDFVYNRLFAWKSSFAIVEEEFDGCLVSNEFPTFEYDIEKVDPYFLLSYVLQPEFIDKVNRLSGGMSSVSRKRFKEEQFIQSTFPDFTIKKQQTVSNIIQKRKQNIQAISLIFSNQSNYLSLLRQSILQEAIEGKLTQAWRKKNSVRKGDPDFDANALLEKIQEEKKKMAEGKSKKEKPLAPIKPEEIPFPLPEGWIWTRLGEIGLLERGKSKHRPRNDTSLFVNGVIPFVQTGEISQSKYSHFLIEKSKHYYNDKGLAQSKLWPAGTLCISIAANIAETGFLKIDACFPDSVVGFNSFFGNFTSCFVRYYVSSIQQQIIKFAPATAQKNINLKIISELIFPLPPLAEQQAIVARVDKLLAMVEELEKNVIEQKTKAEELMQAVLREAFD